MNHNKVISQHISESIVIVDDFVFEKYLLNIQANYFGRADVALPGFQKFFTTSAERELTRAKDMMEYMNKRGGTLDLLPIKVTNAGRHRHAL